MATATAPGDAAWSRTSKLARRNPAMTPCMPCSVAPCWQSRSEASAQHNGLPEVTVIVRWIPLVTAAYGTWVARPGRATMAHPCGPAPAPPEG
jgi:hypothetical protein